MSSITISDWLIILATISGPILAVQAQKFIERARARREVRMSIFYRLMTFRARKAALRTIRRSRKPSART
jgi:ABC-type dipeptide/oligopeptide/nickel transport system permease subunit